MTYGDIRPGGLFLAVAFLFRGLFFPVTALAAPDPTSLEQLQSSARESRLSGDRYWDILLHYQHTLWGVKSFVDDPKFFLADDGRKNPQAEMDATIKGFFEREVDGIDHPRCRFPARYAWLKERLNIDESLLPPAVCARFNEAMKLLDPSSAALVFPSAQVNSITTMFGHTLIRINSGYQSDLLANAVSYSAVAMDANAIIHGFSGVFGLYRGYFSILPYYEKIKTYTHQEHRDMWEYELNLSRDEVRRMAYHLWELENVYFDYYFFDENCSYHLLSLLEAARPSLRLTDRTGSGLRFWVIPSDTIRVVRENGLIQKVTYRASQATKIQGMAERMDDALQRTALDLVNGKAAPQAILDKDAHPDSKIRVLDLSAELLQYRASRKEMDQDAYLKSSLAVLNARSGLGTPETALYDFPTPPEPEQGHRSGRVAAATGYATGRDSWFTEVAWRAAQHDLLDPDDGFMEGSEIQIGAVSARYYAKEKTAELQRLLFFGIISLAPRDRFFQSLSWKVNTGLDRMVFRDGEERLVHRINPGRGLAYRTRLLGLLYVTAEADFLYSPAFGDNYTVGAGVSTGILKRVTDRWKLHLSASGFLYRLGDDFTSAKASLGQNFKVTTNNSITLSVERERTFERYQTESKAAWNYYY